MNVKVSFIYTKGIYSFNVVLKIVRNASFFQNMENVDFPPSIPIGQP